MKIKSIQLENFRNYDQISLDFDEGVNVFLGQNAQGKTNLLEAIYFLSLVHSHRTSDNQSLINQTQESAQINGIIEKNYGEFPLDVVINQNGKKASINHLPTNRLSDYIGNFNVILFAPEDLELVKGGPAIRRKFMDREFGQISANYLFSITQYNKILKDRNLYLKKLQNKSASDLVYLDVMTEQLIESGSNIIFDRYRFTELLEKFAKTIHSNISNNLEELELSYKSSVENQDVEKIANQLRDLYFKNQNREIFQGNTLVGPHRDDLLMFINQQDAYEFGSQGQQRTVALSIKLAEIDLLKEQIGEYPVLLLDDVFSELDSSRQTHLLKSIENKVQTFITTPSINDLVQTLINKPKIFTIENGNVKVENND